MKLERVEARIETPKVATIHFFERFPRFPQRVFHRFRQFQLRSTVKKRVPKHTSRTVERAATSLDSSAEERTHRRDSFGGYAEIEKKTLETLNAAATLLN